LQIYLAVTPQQAHTATTYDCTLIHMAYHIGPASTLLRQNPLLQTQGGLLLVCDQDAPFIDSPEELCAAVLRECSRRNYEGVMLDFEEPVRRDRLRFVETLGNILAEKKKKLFLPVSYGHVAPQANILVDTALSGGTLFEHLKDAAKHSHGRFALDMERIRMDFTLPSYNGLGMTITKEELHTLVDCLSPSVFFSPELCARYFTYSKQGETHFVLFDDADTLKRKLHLGAEAGASAAIFMWSEISDIADQIFKKSS